MITLMASSEQSSSSLPAAAIVAGCALLFTIGSFWWLNARRGRLQSFEPHTFAGCATSSVTLLRIPLVLYNTGAKPIIVQDLQLRFPDEPAFIASLPWRTTRNQLKPAPDDGHAFPAVFAVKGRTAEQLFVEFGAPFPGFLPEARDYRVSIEAKLGHRQGWIGFRTDRVELLAFTLRVGHMVSPDAYITYSNSPRDLSAGDVQKANDALEALARKLAGTDLRH
ncbi:hypothetical protein [Kitasatospora aureofaciens]|uniref:hypothetical protein n=1 Tax=Kitasatospora aureofaciens TaxID=1894 RepID=UPI0036F47590